MNVKQSTNGSVDKSSQLKVQISVWKEEDPDVFAILSPLDRGARSRMMRQMLRSAALIQKGVYVLAVPSIAVGVPPPSKTTCLKTKSSTTRPESATKSVHNGAAHSSPRLCRKTASSLKK